jgi:hypothetical protein
MGQCTQNQNVLQRFAELVVLNRGEIAITQVGSEPSNNALGRVGLEPSEALELSYLRGFLEGIMFGTGDCLDSVVEMLKDQTRQKETGSLIALPTSFEQRRFGG